MATEEPKYIVELKKKSYEIRKYPPMIVAETIISADFKNAGNSGFRILADYIFGNNRSKSRIAMTAPVNQSKSGNGFIIQFTMPESYQLNTLPNPNDHRVKLKQLPSQKVAVLSYTGTWSESRYKKKLNTLISELKKNRIKIKGEPIFARFNPPFMPFFLRRNEIWIEIE